MSTVPTIPEFFSKSVLITGGTGFLGKVLIEKLLRSCPNIENVYMLMRQKKEGSLEARLKDMLNLPLFDVLRSQNADVLKKIKVVSGDVSKLGLGLSREDREMLICNVGVIFHVAASVRFDDSLTDAVLLNTRGTREVVSLALEMKKLDVLVHISTTFCHTDKQIIDEKLYPPHADWRKTIEIAEKMDKNVFNAMTEKYIKPLPNTYTFTKSLAEHVVHDMCNGRIPAVIHRPSVVMPTYEEPFSGWIDSLNGPLALIIGCGTGIIKVVYGDGNTVVDCVVVDILIKSIIISAWRQATFNDHTSKMIVSVYNGSNGEIIPFKLKDNLEVCVNEIKTVTPFSRVLWYPKLAFTQSFFVLYITLLFCQFLPALFIDGVLKVLGKTPMLVKLYRKVYTSSLSFSYFINNQWDFINKKCIDLEKHLVPSDVDSFGFNISNFKVKPYLINVVRGAKKFIMKENDDLEEAKKKLNRMRVVALVFNILWYVVLFWIIFVKMDVIKKICNAGRMSSVYFALE